MEKRIPLSPKTVYIWATSATMVGLALTVKAYKAKGWQEEGTVTQSTSGNGTKQYSQRLFQQYP